MARTSYIHWNDDDVCFVLDQHVLKLDLYRASSLKQQSEGRHVASHSETLTWFQVDQILRLLIKDAVNTNFIVIGSTQPVLEPMIYHTRIEHANHYTTDAAVSL